MKNSLDPSDWNEKDWAYHNKKVSDWNEIEWKNVYALYRAVQLYDLDDYLGAAATRYKTVSSSSVYAAFDTLEEYLDVDGVDLLVNPATWTEKGSNDKLEVVYLSAGDFVSAITVGGTQAKRSFVVDLSGSNTEFGIHVNGFELRGGADLSSTASIAVLDIASETNVAEANAVGVALSAAANARGTATVTFAAIGSSENSPTAAASIANLTDAAKGFLASNTVTLSIDGNSFTYSSTTSSQTATEVATALVTGFNGKFTAGTTREYLLTDNTDGSFAVTSDDIGSDGVSQGITVTWGMTGTASATSLGHTINTASLNDNKTLATSNAVLVTFEASSTGSDLSEIGYPTKAMSTSAKSVKISVTVGTSTVTELSSTAFSNSNTASGVETATNKFPTESRNDVRNPHDGATLRAESGTKINTNKISWI